MIAMARLASLHNMPWRKLRRRCWFDGWKLLEMTAPLVPQVCMVAWLWRQNGWGWLAQITAELWLLGSVVLTVFFAILAFFDIRAFIERARRPSNNRAPVGWYFVTSALAFSGTAAALLNGRMDWAVIAFFGFSIQYHAIRTEREAWRRAVCVLLNLAVIAAFLAHSAGLLIACLCLLPLSHDLLKPPLREAIALRSSHATYVRRVRQMCASGHG
jgi:hypothetical protein